MTGISDRGESSITIEIAARRLNYLHNRRDLAAKSCALLLFKCLDHCSYQIAGHVTAQQLGDKEPARANSSAWPSLSRISWRECFFIVLSSSTRRTATAVRRVGSLRRFEML